MDPIEQRFVQTRRQFFAGALGGVGGAALLSLLDQDRALGAVDGVPHHAPKAKRCIYFHMAGAPSQLDLYTPKPKLDEFHGQRPPADLLDGKRFAFIDPASVTLYGTNRVFSQHGQSGMWFSDMLPGLARHADKICKIQSMHTTQFNHHPAQLVAQTGHNLGGHPTIGSWLYYGLGSENENVPGYVVLNSAKSLSAGTDMWQSGFLPTLYQGTLFQSSGDPVLNLNRPPGIHAAVERRGLDALAQLNELHRDKTLDPTIESRIANYELAFRMQAEAPQLVDLSQETAATLERYGVNRPDPSRDGLSFRAPPGGTHNNFARHCLLARRMVERGVRFVNIFSGSWDHHSHLDTDLQYLSTAADQPMAALIDDLEQSGLLAETLVVIGGEFGRTPLGENRGGDTSNVTGRDHHPDAFCFLLLGAGVKPGLTYGETDDIGWRIAENPVHISDLHATLLHLFGIDHMKLGYEHLGVEQRLTPLTRVSSVVTDILA